jgi:two-component system NtrC family sensor kinase
VERWYRLATIGSLAIPALLFAVVAWITYVQAQDDARERLERTARVAQEHASRVVETNEVISRAILNVTAGLSSRDIAAREDELHRQLARMAADLPQLHSLWIWSPEGRPLVSSRFYPVPAFSVADREYFIATKARHGDSWFVSRALVSRSNGQTFFNFSRRRETEDGQFDGAVSVSLYPSYFLDFYRELSRREPGLVVSLLRDDGAVIATTDPTAAPELPSGDPLMRALRAGARVGEFTQGEGDGDGAHRIAFRRIERLPLYAVVSLDGEAILRDWRADMAVLAGFAFPLALGLAFVVWLAKTNALRLTLAVDAYREQVEQRARAEEALRQSQKLEALGQITGGVAHDFNNVLMVVQSANELARRQVELGQDATHAMASVESAVKTGTQLTRQLLTFARRQPLQVAVVSLHTVVPPLLSLVQTTVGGSIRVQGSVDEDVGPVRMDVAEFELALINLAVNARDAMPSGGRLQIRVRSGFVAADGSAPVAGAKGATRRAVIVSVIDSGQGIPAAIRERVFEPFFTTKGPGVGTGLGLSQVYGFATQAGGSVGIESATGRGTTVTLRLPVSDEAPATEGVLPARLPALHGRLLLVEDNDDVANALRPLLEQLGLGVERAPGADVALQLLRGRPSGFDVVLSDIVMPGTMTGIELAAEIARLAPALPIVLMSGYTPQLQRAIASGLTVLPKPCSPAALAAALEKVLRQPRAFA